MIKKVILCSHTAELDVVEESLRRQSSIKVIGRLNLAEKTSITASGKCISIDQAQLLIEKEHAQILIVGHHYYEYLKVLVGAGIEKKDIEIHPLSFFY